MSSYFSKSRHSRNSDSRLMLKGEWLKYGTIVTAGGKKWNSELDGLLQGCKIFSQLKSAFQTFMGVRAKNTLGKHHIFDRKSNRSN